MSASNPSLFSSGATFADRRALHDAGIHPGSFRGGISSRGEAIVISGGYVDDIDEGDIVVYTGQGGRDPNSGKQIADQTFERGNHWLQHNCVEGIPVRVTRGHQLDSPYAPPNGYRYDGLYQVVSYWQEKGRDGFVVCRFRLERLPGQPAIGDSSSQNPNAQSASQVSGNVQPRRELITSSRVVRSTEVGNKVKELYKHTCQTCSIRLETPAGPYAEGCHIRPLGKPHNGPDTTDNVLCLCPNCHVLFDTYAVTIDETFSVIPKGRKLTVEPSHAINLEHIRYRLAISGNQRQSK